MKKKITSLIAIVAMLLLPFSMLLTVKATDTTANGITYDNATTKSGDSSSYLVTQQGNIFISHINTNADGSSPDTLTAYKVIDTYYNPTTNQMSYAFTSSFATFISSLPSTDDFYQYSLSNYLALTSPVSNQDGNASTTFSNGQVTESAISLNALASKFASYIRANEGTANAVTGITMTTVDTNSDNINDSAKATNVAAGSYLVLRNVVSAKEKSGETNDGYPIDYLSTYTYRVMVANLFYTVNNQGAWTLPDATIAAKANEGYMGMFLYPASMATLGDLGSDEAIAEYLSTRDIGSFTNITRGDTALLMSEKYEPSVIPSNAHTSIAGNTDVEFLLRASKIELASGLSYDLSFIENMYGNEMTHSGNQYTIIDGGDPAVIIETVNAQSLYFAVGVILEITASDSYNFTAGAANTITVTRYYIKDPYVDIGSNVTKEAIDTALATTSGATAQQLKIQQAIGKYTQELSLYLYGVKVNNTNTSETNLSGGVFQAYSDSECTNPIGGSFTASNGVASFVGISGYDTIYVKQTKAPTGYKLYDKTLYLIPTEEESQEQGTAFNSRSAKVKRLTSDQYHDEVEVELDQDNYYTVTVVNQPMGFLPFTGGTGTIIYTAIGLLIVVGAAVFLIIYKKKNKKDEDK